MGNKVTAVSLFPERFIIILTSAILTKLFELDKKGLQVVGNVEGSNGLLPTLQWPIKSWDGVRSAASTSLFIALMGYFESSVTTKSLQSTQFRGPCDPDRELVALGVANLIGGCFGTLPAFGGFGRSKLNEQAGGQTPMASIFLCSISFLCAVSISPWLFYVPRPVLAAMSCAVGISMLQECQHDISVFRSMSAWRELGFAFLVASAMFLHSMELGAGIGLCLTVLSVIHSATRSRATIYGQSQLPIDTNARPSMDTRRITLVRLGQVLSFANVGHACREMRHAINIEESYRTIVLDLGDVQEMDFCGGDMLGQEVARFVKESVDVQVVLPKGHLGDLALRVQRIMQENGALTVG